MLPEPINDELQNIAIATEFSLFGLRFQFCVKSQELGVGMVLPCAAKMGRNAENIPDSQSIRVP